MDRKRQLEKVSSSMLTRYDWRVLEAVVDILKPIKDATKVLESESKPTINRLAETIFDIEVRMDEIRSKNDVPSEAKLFSKELKRSIQKRFPNYGLGDKHVGFANFLDPRLKGIHLEQIGRFNDYIHSVKIALSGVDGIGTSEDVDMTEERLVDDAALTPTLKLLKKKFNPLSSTFDSRSNGEKVAEKEV